MAASFESEHIFLLPEYAEHINEHHFKTELTPVSRFNKDVNLTELLKTLGERATTNQVEELEEGSKKASRMGTVITSCSSCKREWSLVPARKASP